MLNPPMDVHSLSEFKKKTPEFLDNLKATGHPIVLTVKGKAALVIQDAAGYQQLLNRVILNDEEEMNIFLERSLKDADEGRTTPAVETIRQLAEKHFG